MARYGEGTVFQRADGLWIGRLEAGWNASGNRRRIQVKARSQTDARRKLVKKRREIEALGFSESATVTVKRWADEWLARHGRELSPNTYRNYASVVGLWIVPTIGAKRLERLTPGDLRAVTKAAEDAGRKASTTLFARRVLVKMLRDAVLEGHRVPERLFLVRAPSRNATDRDRIPTPDAVDLIRAAVERPDGSRWVVAFLQGLRQGEALGLTWDRVDLDRGVLDIEWQLDALPYLDRAAGTFRTRPGEKVIPLWRSYHLVPVKTRSGRRVIPIIEEVAEALRIWRTVAPVSDAGLVFPRPDGRPRSSESDRREWYDLQDAAEVASVAGAEGRRYHVHEIRHTTATLLLEAGVDPKTVEAILGHSSIVTSRGYQHVSTTLAREAISKVAEGLQLSTKRAIDR